MVEGANEHNVPARRVVHVTREQWREHTRQERERRAEEKRARLLEACRMAREAAEQEDAWMDSVERAPIYSPTEAEWADPLAYIRSIQAEASQYGICIVRAPVAPTTPGGLCMALQDPAFKFDTRQQAVRDSPWEDFSGGVTFQYGKRYSLREFQDAACAAAAKRFGGLHGCLPPRFIEREYWRERERRDGPPLVVEYGNDVDGSLFLEQDRLGASRWNLNSLPLEPGSALRHCGRPIAGVSTPMLYVGQLFSTFAWHVEDHFIFSINYQHLGASKTWYGVPASDADGFERVARDSVYAEAVAKLVQAGASEAEVWGQVERALMGKTTMFSPRLLVEAGVRVCRAVQAVGDYVLTFPRTYHAGFGNGFQVGEAVNFGMGDWWPFGEDARQRYRRLRHPAILPQEQVLCDEALQLAERRRREAAQQAEQRHEKAAHKPYCSPAGLVPSPPATPPPTEASGCAALAHTFVGAMRRLNHCRGALEAAGAVPLLACPHGSPEAALSLHCAECQQLCYVATAVLQPAGEPASWRHLCLECAAASLPSTPAATAETGLPASVPQPHGGVEVAAALPPLLFVKPCWADLEECARQLEREGVPDLSTLPLTLPLCGTTEQERYGRRHDPGWPSASQPYAWQPLLKLHERLPGSVRPAAPAPAQAAGEAGEGASQLLPQRAAQQLSPLQAFHVAVKSEEGEGAAHAAARSRPDTTQRQQHAFAGAPAEAAEAGITTKPAASQQLQQQPCPKAPSLPAEQQQADRHQEAPAEGEEVTCLQQRQDVQQGPQQAQQRQPEASQETGAGREAKRPPRRRDSSGPLLSSLQEPLPVAANGAVLVAGQRVQRQAWRDTTGECVLLATAVLEAMGRRDPREASTRTMGTMLRRAGAGAVPRAFLSGVGHGARAVVNQQHVGHLLAWHELQEGERAALRQYVAGVWPTWPAELGHDEDTPATANQLGSLSAGFSEEQLQQQQQLMEEEQQGEEEQQQQKGPSPASRWKPSPVPQQRQLKQLQQLQPPEQAQHDYDQHEDEAPAAKRQRPRIPQASASTDGKSRAATAVLEQALRGGYNDQMTPQVGGERREDGGRASRPVQQQESLQRATAVSVGATASMRPVCSGGATASASQHSGAAEGAPADSQLQSPATTSATTATASLGARMEAQPPAALLVPSSALAGRTEPRKSQNMGGPAGPRPELAGAAKALRWDQQAGQARLQAAAAAAEALHRHRLQKEQQLSLALQQQQGLEAELARMRQAKQLQQQAALRRQQEVEQQRRMVQEHQLQQQARQRPTRQGSQPWGPGGLSGSSSGPVPTPKESATPLDAPIMSLPYPSDEVDEILFMLGAQSPLGESPVGGPGAPAAPQPHASALAGARAEPASALPPGWPGLKGSLGESTRPASRGGAAAMRVAGGRAGSIPSAALIPPLPDSAAVLGPQRAQQHLRQQPSGTDASKSNRRQAAGGQLPDAGGGVGQGSADLGLGGSLRGVDAGLAGRSSAAARAAPSWPLQSDADLQRCVAAAIAGDREARAASARYMQQSGGVQRLLKLGLPVDLVAWLATP